jgi:hypothetical protein
MARTAATRPTRTRHTRTPPPPRSPCRQLLRDHRAQEFARTGNADDADVLAFDDLTGADASQVVPPNVVPEPST